MPSDFEKTITIDAPVPAVWDALTRPEQMTRWMAEPEMRLEIDTGWIVGGPFTMRGVHHARFENRGTLLQFDANHVLRYTHLSSLSRLPDTPANHSVIAFRLIAIQERTSLTLTVGNFPTETIRKHLEFYWRTTVDVLKAFVEHRVATSRSTASS